MSAEQSPYTSLRSK